MSYVGLKPVESGTLKRIVWSLATNCNLHIPFLFVYEANLEHHR